MVQPYYWNNQENCSMCLVIVFMLQFLLLGCIALQDKSLDQSAAFRQKVGLYV